MFIFVLATMFAAGNSAFAQTIAASDISEIMLETADGFCADCERITTLRGDGTAAYHGGKNSQYRPGESRGKFSREEFEKLAAFVVAQDFSRLKDRYEGSVSDVAEVKITVVYQGGQKTVVNWGGSDLPQLLAIKKAFESAASKIGWRTIVTPDEMIESHLMFRSFAFDDVLARFDFADSEIEKNAQYEKLKNLTAIADKDGEVPTFFFRGKRQVLIYHTAEMLKEDDLKPNDFYQKFGKQFVELPSRAGKKHRQIVYPNKGIAFSTDGESLDFLEIFAPTTIAKYKREIYKTVPAFIK